MGGLDPLRGAAAADDPETGFSITANNRVAPADYPHHITSDYLDGYRAQRIEELLQARAEHDLESFESIQTDMQSSPASRRCTDWSG